MCVCVGGGGGGSPPLLAFWGGRGGGGGGGGAAPYNGLYGEAPPKRGTFFEALGI